MASIKKTLNVEIKGLKDFESLAKNAEKIGDNFEEIRKRQVALNQQLKNVKVGSDQYKAIKAELEKIDTVLESVSASADQAFDSKKIDDANDSLKDFENTAENVDKNIKTADKSSSKLGKNLKTISTTLKVSIIGAIVTIAAGLAQIFSQTQSGVDFFNRLSFTLQRTGKQIIEVFKNGFTFVKSFINLVSSGVDFIGAKIRLIGFEIKEALNPLANEYTTQIKNAANEVENLSKAFDNSADQIGKSVDNIVSSVVTIFTSFQKGQQQFDKYNASLKSAELAAIDLAVAGSELNRFISENDKIIDDTNKSLLQRQIALKNTKEAQQELSDLQEQAAKTALQAEVDRLVGLNNLQSVVIETEEDFKNFQQTLINSDVSRTQIQNLADRFKAVEEQAAASAEQVNDFAERGASLLFDFNEVLKDTNQSFRDFRRELTQINIDDLTKDIEELSDKSADFSDEITKSYENISKNINEAFEIESEQINKDFESIENRLLKTGRLSEDTIKTLREGSAEEVNELLNNAQIRQNLTQDEIARIQELAIQREDALKERNEQQKEADEIYEEAIRQNIIIRNKLRGEEVQESQEVYDEGIESFDDYVNDLTDPVKITQSFDAQRKLISKKYDELIQVQNDAINDLADAEIDTNSGLSQFQQQNLENFENLTVEEQKLLLKNKDFIKDINNETLDALRTYVDERDKLEKEKNENLEETNEKEAALLEKLNEDIKKFIEGNSEEISKSQELFGSLAELGNVLFDNAIRRIEEQQEKIAQEIDRTSQIADEKADAAQENLRNIQSLEDQLASGREQNFNQTLAKLDEERRERRKNLDEQKKAENQRQEFLRQEEKLQAEKEKKEKQRARLNKVRGIADATINTAVAVTAALPNVVLSAIIGALGAVQIATIAATKTFKKGGKVEEFADGGLAVGPSHAQGGIPFTVQGRGGFELEGGEYIVNKKSTAKFLPLLESINSTKFQDGGLVKDNNIQVTTTQNNDELVNAVRDLRNRPARVSVQEIRDVNTTVSVIETESEI